MTHDSATVPQRKQIAQSRIDVVRIIYAERRYNMTTSRDRPMAVARLQLSS